MRRMLGIFAISMMCAVLPAKIRAEYVLPYPSYMPGNKLYRITRIIDRMKQPLYFGNLSSYTYHLSLSDKYLVEAKTLFEYKQYLLGVDALSRSDREFLQLPYFLNAAKKEGKDTAGFTRQFSDASLEHVRILNNLQKILPSSFEWKPEKSNATVLSLKDLIATSIGVREQSISTIQ